MHTPVLAEEVFEALDFKAGEIFVDATVGSAGHSASVAERTQGAVRIIGLDADSAALERAGERLRLTAVSFHLVNENFRHFGRALDSLGVSRVNKVLFDLGMSSDQLEKSGRGFSFERDEPLLMTYAASPGPADLTAEKLLATMSEEALTDALFAYGDERYARRIARAIVERRRRSPLRTTFDLVRIVRGAVPLSYERGRIHFATRTFQALRVTVNDEFRALADGLKSAFKRLTPRGRLAVIAFHSGEDRIVKNTFRQWSKAGLAHLVTKKPIGPREDELLQNRRARSAKLRVIEKK